MFQETVVNSRADREIRKTIITPGDYNIVPYEDSRCKVSLKEIKCTNNVGPCEIDSKSHIFSPNFDGNVMIGDTDSFIDKDFELILQQMCCGEVCSARLIYRNSVGSLVKEITCEVHLQDVTEEQLISDWSWNRLYESANHHKERGVVLVKEKRILEAFRRFSKALKMLIAIEPIDPDVIAEEQVKEMIDMKVKLYNNLAHCQLQFDEFDAALELCGNAIKFDPDNVKAHYRRSVAYTGLKLYEEAWRDIQFVLKIDPSDKAAQVKATELRPMVEKINQNYTNVIKKMFTA